MVLEASCEIQTIRIQAGPCLSTVLKPLICRSFVRKCRRTVTKRRDGLQGGQVCCQSWPFRVMHALISLNVVIDGKKKSDGSELFIYVSELHDFKPIVGERNSDFTSIFRRDLFSCAVCPRSKRHLQQFTAVILLY